MRWLFVVLALAMLVAACRRDRGDDDSPSATPTPAVTTQPQSPTVISTPTGAVSGDPFSPGVHPGTMTVGGIERTYRVYVPSSLREGDAPPPLLIGLHGGIGSGQQFENQTEFDRVAEEGKFIAAYPDGTGVARTWNGGNCCGYAVREDVDDVAFISALIDAVAQSFPIDSKRVYAVGHSNGGIMAFRLACELSDKIAAIGPVAASLEIPSCSPDRPVPVLLIHGDADQNHPLEGGVGPEGVSGVAFNSVADTMETMRSAMGCSSDSTVSFAGAITTTDWLGCSGGVAVRLQVIAGASHPWPGARFSGFGGEPSQAMDASRETWAFVSQYSLP